MRILYEYILFVNIITDNIIFYNNNNNNNVSIPIRVFT